jgi:hypothetical protein
MITPTRRTRSWARSGKGCASGITAAPPSAAMKSRRFMSAPSAGYDSVSIQAGRQEGLKTIKAL